jgi:hypothetical protein
MILVKIFYTVLVSAVVILSWMKTLHPTTRTLRYRYRYPLASYPTPLPESCLFSPAIPSPRFRPGPDPHLNACLPSSPLWWYNIFSFASSFAWRPRPEPDPPLMCDIMLCFWLKNFYTVLVSAVVTLSWMKTLHPSIRSLRYRYRYRYPLASYLTPLPESYPYFDDTILFVSLILSFDGLGRNRIRL